MNGGLLKATEAATIAGMSPATIRTWIREGRVPGLGVKIGSVFYVRRTALVQLLGLEDEARMGRGFWGHRWKGLDDSGHGTP